MKDLSKVLENYGFKGEVIKVNEGPLIKQIEFLPATGTKVKNIISSVDDIARELGVSSLRVDQVEGSHNLGFEVPADDMKTIDFEEIINSSAFASATGNLPMCLGVDITGKPIFADLAKMPHLLVAGTTGSGKSVGLNTFILSLIKLKTPDELKFVLIDPKRIEFSIYNNQKYMLCPVVTDNELASDTLQYLVLEMERRYKLFEESLSKNISDYKDKGEKMPYIVCVVDEFADLIASNKKVEKSIQMLAQKARACGIHIILATQRPSVDVVTGVLKANFPTRLSYKVASRADSQTILDTSGAESLIGRGDSLFLSGDGSLKRIHGAYMSDDKIAKMLAPYKITIHPLELEKEAVLAGKEVVVKQGNYVAKTPQKKSFFKRTIEFWGNLRQRDKKMIISAASWFFGYITGLLQAKKSRKDK